MSPARDERRQAVIGLLATHGDVHWHDGQSAVTFADAVLELAARLGRVETVPALRPLRVATEEERSRAAMTRIRAAFERPGNGLSGAVSQVGKTQLRGHGLRHEGELRYRSSGHQATAYWDTPREELHAKCSCGALSPAGISKNAAKRWHREHKDAVRALSAPSGASEGEWAHGDGTAAQRGSQGESRERA